MREGHGGPTRANYTNPQKPQRSRSGRPLSSAATYLPSAKPTRATCESTAAQETGIRTVHFSTGAAVALSQRVLQQSFNCVPKGESFTSLAEPGVNGAQGRSAHPRTGRQTHLACPAPRPAHRQRYRRWLILATVKFTQANGQQARREP
jgi:hypothetical protein